MSEKEFERVAEELSALVDGEVSELELRRVLKSVEQDPSLGDRWYRYQVTSSVLQRQSVLGFDPSGANSLSDRVRGAIADEPALEISVKSNAGRSWRERLLRPVASAAVAASVSAIVVFSWQSGEQGDMVSSPVVATQSASPVVLSSRDNGPLMTVSQGSNAGSVASGVEQPEIIRMSSENQQRLNYYLMSHSSSAAFSTATGLAPQARAVSAQPPLQPGVSQALLEQ